MLGISIEIFIASADQKRTVAKDKYLLCIDKSHILHVVSKAMMIQTCICVIVVPSQILLRRVLHLLICKNCIWGMQWGIIPFSILNRRSSTRRLVSHNENIEGQPEGSGRSQKSFAFSMGVALIPKNCTWLRHFQKKPYT